jgi:putative nucleotidyltransferase with HDIG domain
VESAQPAASEALPKAAPRIELDSLIGKQVNVPPIPLVAKKVMELVNDPYVSGAIIKKAISADQALAARVIRMANSAFYAPREMINDLGMAVVILGFETIKELVVSASLKGIYKTMGLVQKMLWEHSVAVSVGTRVIAQRYRLATDGTLVAGLLHDVGKVIMLNSHPDLYQEVVERVYNGRRSFVEAEQHVFGFNHTEVGVLLVRKWNFSLELGKVVQYHHKDDFRDIQPPEVSRLTASVSLADLIARRLGLGYRAPDEAVDIAGSPAAATLRMSPLDLDEAACAHLSAEVEATFEKENGVFT